MSRVVVKQHSSPTTDQSPTSNPKVQNGPQRLQTASIPPTPQQQSQALVKPKPLGSKNYNMMMEIKEYEPETYAKNQHSCRQCSAKFTLSDLYQHYETEHRLCFCVYCQTAFETRIQLTSHLETDHRISTQTFKNFEEFNNNNGKQANLMCVKCKEVFCTAAQQAGFKHQCSAAPSSPFKLCKFCKFPISIYKILDHASTCTARTSPTKIGSTSEKSAEAPLPPLRSRDRSCKKCLQPISPAKLAQHIKNCNGIPSPAQRSSKEKIIKCSSCKSPVVLSKLQEHKRLCRRMSSASVVEVEEDSKEELVPLDPLLLEQDPVKRVNMLITSLIEYINLENKKFHDSKDGEAPLFTVEISGELKEKSVNWIIQQLILQTSEKCLYCRQAILIRVDKRQLVLHLFINHRFRIQLIPEKSIAPIEESPEVKTEEVAAVVQELLTKSEILVNSNAETETTTHVPGTSDSLEGDQKPSESVTMTTTTPETDQLSIQQPISTVSTQQHSTEVALINEHHQPPTRPADSKTINWDEFEHTILQQIFHSTDVLFCYDRGDVVFGKMPCNCLLCGQHIDSQLKLFAHWRVAHKGVAMRCAMCTGRFLFSGSLFSHHCFGTPQLFEEVRQAALHEAQKSDPQPGAQPSHSTQAYADAETSNSTMLLRYQCEFCGIQLPGFFNYMVHIRKIHNTCELCLETVENQKLLDRHHRRHKLQHFCWKCGIPYLAKPNYIHHLFWKHGAESKLCYTCLEKKWPFIYHFCLPPAFFTCETCGLQFTRPISLLVHKRLHSNEKLRKCTSPSCPERFISKKLLEKHIEAVHKAPKAILPPKTEDTESNQLATADVKSEVESQSSQKAGEDNELKDIKEQPIEGEAAVQPVDTKPVAEEDEMKMETEETDEKDKDRQDVHMNESPIKMEEDQEQVEDVFQKEHTSNTSAGGSGDMEHINPTTATADTTTAPGDTDDRVGCNSTVPPPEDVHSTTASMPEPEPSVNQNEHEQLMDMDVSAQSSSPSPRKSRKHKNYNVSSLHGPNLSEEESDEDEEESEKNQQPAKDGEAERVGQGQGEPNETISALTPVSSPPSAGGGEPCSTTPNLDMRLGNFSSMIQSELRESDVLSTAIPPTPVGISELKDISTEGAEYTELTGGTLSPETPSTPSSRPRPMQLEIPTPDTPDKQDDSSQNMDDFQAMSPLLPPLDTDFPDIPTLEDGAANSAQYILQYAALDHDYSLPPPKEEIIEPKRKQLDMSSSSLQFDDSGSRSAPTKKPKTSMSSPKFKKMHISSPKKKGSSLKRKRHHSTSSSSSSSSSCSSCGSNCSCSSSSSSSDEDESSPNKESMQMMKSPVKEKKKVAKVMLKRLKKTTPAKPKKPKVVKDPNIPKRPVGRPPKYPKDGPRPPPPKPKTAKQNAEQRLEKMLKHFKNKEDAYIPESDLDTDLSDSEEKFEKQQMEEVIGVVPPAFNEVWYQSNEKFLLQIVKGVKDLQELRPKPKPKPAPVLKPQMNANANYRTPPSSMPGTPPQHQHHHPMAVKNNSYKVVTKPEANGKQPRLKLRNVPLKKLYLVPTGGSGGGYHHGVVPRPPVLKSGFTHNSALNILPPALKTNKSRGVPHGMAPIPGTSRASMMGQQVQTNSRTVLNKIHPNNMNSMAHARPLVREQSYNNAAPALPMAHSPVAATASAVSIAQSPVSSSSPAVAAAFVGTPEMTVEPIMMPMVPKDSATALQVEPTTAASIIPSQMETPASALQPLPPSEEQPINNNVGGGESQEPNKDQPKYCYCQKDDGDSEMIGCDGENCKIEWFHFKCVGVVVAPKGKWYCPDCRKMVRPTGRGKKSSSRASMGENRPKPQRNGIPNMKGDKAMAMASGVGSELLLHSDNNMDMNEFKKNLAAAAVATNSSPVSHPLLDSYNSL